MFTLLRGPDQFWKGEIKKLHLQPFTEGLRVMVADVNFGVRSFHRGD